MLGVPTSFSSIFCENLKPVDHNIKYLVLLLASNNGVQNLLGHLIIALLFLPSLVSTIGLYVYVVTELFIHVCRAFLQHFFNVISATLLNFIGINF